MAIPFIDDPVQLVRQFNAFAFGLTCPAQISERAQTIPGTHADVICQGAELLWTAYDLLTAEDRVLLAQLAAYGTAQAWTAADALGRFGGMVKAVQRDSGAPGDYPPRAADPPPILPLEPNAPFQPPPGEAVKAA